MELLYTIGAKIIAGFRQLKVSVDDRAVDCMYVTPYGIDGIPINGLNAVKTNTQAKTVVIGFIQKAVDGLDKGDVILFSKDDTGTIVSKIIMKANGKILVTSDDTIDINNGNLTIEP